MDAKSSRVSPRNYDSLSSRLISQVCLTISYLVSKCPYKVSTKLDKECNGNYFGVMELKPPIAWSATYTLKSKVGFGIGPSSSFNKDVRLETSNWS